CRSYMSYCIICVFFFSSRRRHTRFSRDWSSDVCSSDLVQDVPAWAAARLLRARSVGLSRNETIFFTLPHPPHHSVHAPHPRPRSGPRTGRSEERRVGQVRR